MADTRELTGWWPDFFEPFRTARERMADWFSPRSDASDNEKAYEIAVELPGVKPEDISVEVSEGVLTVKGEKRMETKEEKAGYFFSERQYGRFQRSFRLPADAVGEKVSASHRDGVLTVTVPKREAKAAETKKIEVKAS